MNWLLLHCQSSCHATNINNTNNVIQHFLQILLHNSSDNNSFEKMKMKVIGFPSLLTYYYIEREGNEMRLKGKEKTDQSYCQFHCSSAEFLLLAWDEIHSFPFHLPPQSGNKWLEGSCNAINIDCCKYTGKARPRDLALGHRRFDPEEIALKSDP